MDSTIITGLCVLHTVAVVSAHSDTWHARDDQSFVNQNEAGEWDTLLQLSRAERSRTIQSMRACDSKFEIHYRIFAIMRNVTLRVSRWEKPFGAGGEKLQDYKGQYLHSDDAETLKPRRGLWELNCPQKLDVSEKLLIKIPMTRYITVQQPSMPAFDRVSNFTIAIERQEYANFYHIMLHMYNMFIMLVKFHRQPRNISILVLDAHPLAEIDKTLTTLFGPIIRIGRLKTHVVFDSVVISLTEKDSPLSKFGSRRQPYLEEFRSFVLGRHVLDTGHRLDCARLQLTLLIRRDKPYHPRNMKGSVERKIMNDAQLHQALIDRLPGVCISSVLLDALPMREQLQIIRTTDILVGMHGAGLTHTLFLPKTSALVELFPYRFKTLHTYYGLFEALARWRHLHYTSWENRNGLTQASNQFTIVDVSAVVSLVERTVGELCPHPDMGK